MAVGALWLSFRRGSLRDPPSALLPESPTPPAWSYCIGQKGGAMHSPNGRRSFLRGALALGGAFWADETLEALPQNVNTNSKPSDLKITDLRVLTIDRKSVV